MKIPKKISPDSIKDSIIELRYTSKIPYQVLVGFIFNSLDDTYHYTNKPIHSQKLNSQSSFGLALPSEITFNLGNNNIFFTDKIKIELTENSFIFNCLKDYLGWDEYFIEISKVIEQISKISHIEMFTRIGLRYISEYNNIDIRKITNYSFTFGIEEVKSDSYTFRTEFFWDDFRVILNLQNKIPSLKTNFQNNKPEISPISIIDIDVIKDINNSTSINDLFVLIQQVHAKEKEIFFRLLTDDFVKTLNPIY